MKRLARAAAGLLLVASTVLAQAPLAPPPAIPGAPPPPALPGYDDLSRTATTPTAGGANPAVGPQVGIDYFTLLEIKVLRIQNFQHDALAAMDRATAATTSDARTKALQDIVTAMSAVDLMLGGDGWKDAVASARALDSLATSRNQRYINLFAPNGALDMIDRTQARIRAFNLVGASTAPIATPVPPPFPTGIGLPPTPMKGDKALPPLPTVLPVPPPSTLPPTVTPTPTPSGEDIAAIQKKVDDIGIQLANPNLTRDQRNVLEITRNAYVQRIAELARKLPGAVDNGTPAPVQDGHQPAPAATSNTNTSAAPMPGTTGVPSTATPAPNANAQSSTSAFLINSGSTETRGGAASPASPTATVDPALAARVPLVPNSYGITPMVVSDAEIRGIMEPLIAQLLPAENAKLASEGLSMNKYRQVTGTTGKVTILSAGKPDYDHYAMWLKDNAQMRTLVNQRAAQIQADRARAIAATQAPPPPPAPTADPNARTPGATAPQNSALPPGTTLPNGKLDLPSSSAGK